MNPCNAGHLGVEGGDKKSTVRFRRRFWFEERHSIMLESVLKRRKNEFRSVAGRQEVGMEISKTMKEIDLSRTYPEKTQGPTVDNGAEDRGRVARGWRKVTMRVRGFGVEVSVDQRVMEVNGDIKERNRVRGGSESELNCRMPGI